MSPHTSRDWFDLWSTVAICVVFLIYLKQLWQRPLDHGPGFFLGVKVPPGFYEGEGIRWLRRWHTVVARLVRVRIFGGAASRFHFGPMVPRSRLGWRQSRGLCGRNKRLHR